MGAGNLNNINLQLILNPKQARALLNTLDANIRISKLKNLDDLNDIAYLSPERLLDLINIKNALIGYFKETESEDYDKKNYK